MVPPTCSYLPLPFGLRMAYLENSYPSEGRMPLWNPLFFAGKMMRFVAGLASVLLQSREVFFCMAITKRGYMLSSGSIPSTPSAFFIARSAAEFMHRRMARFF